MDYYNSKFAKLLAPHGAFRWAKTIGQRTWYSVPKERVDEAWRRHENKHKEQYRRDGFWGFQRNYLRDYWRNRLKGMSHMAAYWATSYEIEARRAERADSSNPV